MTMRSWPGKSNGTGDGSGSGSVSTPDKCPLCGTKDFEQLPAHLRDDCSGANKQLVTDGGTSPDDAGTVAWCPGCKRYIKSENETSHVRRKHLRSYPGEIQSRYRRVAHPSTEDGERIATDGGENHAIRHSRRDDITVTLRAVVERDGHDEVPAWRTESDTVDVPPCAGDTAEEALALMGEVIDNDGDLPDETSEVRG